MSFGGDAVYTHGGKRPPRQQGLRRHGLTGAGQVLGPGSLEELEESLSHYPAPETKEVECACSHKQR